MYNYDTYLLLVKLCCFRVQSLEESSRCLINNSCSISTLSRAFLDCESLIHVDILCLFVCYSCVAPTFLWVESRSTWPEYLDKLIYFDQVKTETAYLKLAGTSNLCLRGGRRHASPDNKLLSSQEDVAQTALSLARLADYQDAMRMVRVHWGFACATTRGLRPCQRQICLCSRLRLAQSRVMTSGASPLHILRCSFCVVNSAERWDAPRLISNRQFFCLFKRLVWWIAYGRLDHCGLPRAHRHVEIWGAFMVYACCGDFSASRRVMG